MTIKIDYNLCVGCGTCVAHCLHHALKIVNKHSVVDPSICVGCGMCTDYCPNDALDLDNNDDVTP